VELGAGPDRPERSAIDVNRRDSAGVVADDRFRWPQKPDPARPRTAGYFGCGDGGCRRARRGKTRREQHSTKSGHFWLPTTKTSISGRTNGNLWSRTLPIAGEMPEMAAIAALLQSWFDRV